MPCPLTASDLAGRLLRGLTVHAEHHADRRLPDRVPCHTFIAASVCGSNVTDGEEPLGADVKFPAFRHLNPILEQNKWRGRGNQTKDPRGLSWRRGTTWWGLANGALLTADPPDTGTILPAADSRAGTPPTCCKRPRKLKTQTLLCGTLQDPGAQKVTFVGRVLGWGCRARHRACGSSQGRCVTKEGR